jgi:hypothetical protein
MAFQIHVEYTNVTIKIIVIDEGSSTSMMSLAYWKAIGRPPLSQSMTMLISLDGHYFIPHGIFPSFMVQLGSNII